jgi:hypothetical protein
MLDEPQGAYMIDFARLRQCDVFEEVERSLLASSFKPIERELGCPLAALDRVTGWVRIDAEGTVAQRVTVFDGAVTLPPWAKGEGWTETKYGDHPAMLHEGLGEAAALAAPRLLVFGAAAHLESVLLGKAAPGRPGADLLQLLSRGEPLLYVFADLQATRRSPGGGFAFLDEVQYPEDDPATCLLLAMVQAGTADEPRLLLRAVVRHQKGVAGLQATETAAKAWFAGLRQHPRLGALKKIWDGIALSRDGHDLVAQLELGSPRAAAATMTQLAAPLFMLRRVEARQAAQAAPAAPAAPVPAKPKVEEKK